MIGEKNAGGKTSDTEIDSSVEEVSPSKGKRKFDNESGSGETPAAPKKLKISKRRRGDIFLLPLKNTQLFTR